MPSSRPTSIFRARYTPKDGSAVIDAGDPADNDSQGRRTDIGAIDVGSHDQDKLGKFGTPPAELVPPTVTLTSPTSGAMLSGKATLSATAEDNPGGTGVVLVQFLVDGATVGSASTSPYATTFDTATVEQRRRGERAERCDQRRRRERRCREPDRAAATASASVEVSAYRRTRSPSVWRCLPARSAAVVCGLGCDSDLVAPCE